MNLRCALPRMFLSFVVLAVLCSATLVVVVAADIPIIDRITPPSSFSPTGNNTFSVAVHGGTPPYTYLWTASAGVIGATPIFEGTGYATAEIPAGKMRNIGPEQRAVWVSVTDARGQQALWMRDNGLGASPEFLCFFATKDYKTWYFSTEPKSFPYKSAVSSENHANPPSIPGQTGGPNAPPADNGGLPLVPIVAVAGGVIVAGIIGAKILGAGAGAAPPNLPPDSPPDPPTREYTDYRGVQHTATQQPDGTWINDEGNTIDLTRNDDAKRQQEDDLRHLAGERDKQIAADTAKAAADKKELDAVKAAGDKAVSDARKDNRDYQQWKQDRDAEYANMYKNQADKLNSAVKGAEWTVTAADVGVNILEKVTPGGTMIKTAYVATKDIGKNISDSAMKGENLVKGAIRGTLEGGFDLGFDAAKKMLPQGSGNWSFKGSTTDLGKGLADGVKSATQSAGVKTIVKDPIKTMLKSASDKYLGGYIGTFK